MIAALALIAIGAVVGILALESEHQILDPGEIGKFPIPPYSFDNWTDWETWEASPEIVKLLPYQRSGYDNDGLVVYLVDFGKWSFRTVAQLSQEGEEEFWKHYEQLIRREQRDDAMCNGQGIVFLSDWDGFSLKNYASAKALKESVKMFASMMQLNDHIKYGFFVNVNFAAETFIGMARPFLGFLEDKFEIYGTRLQKWKSRILKSIPADQLPLKYGGVKDWKPLPLN